MPRCVIFVAIALLSLAGVSIGQQSTPATSPERKVMTRVAPSYPELARRMHIGGVVKVEAIVRPNGTVKSARALGGHPVLVDAAITAVQKWKFEPAQSESTEVVQVLFEWSE
jgi:TonB family protein